MVLPTAGKAIFWSLLIIKQPLHSLRFFSELIIIIKYIYIKIPKNIFGKKYGYSLEGFVDELNDSGVSDFKGSLRLKSSDGCKDINVDPTSEDYCGWLILSMSFTAAEKICNLCEISYSLCFDPVKIKLLYGQCENQDDENVEFPMETCLLLCKAPVDL